MTARILVAYASKYGATAEIAEQIGSVLQQAGTVQVLPIEEAEHPTNYDAIVIGSAVYMGQWRKELVHYLEDHVEVLAERPLWLFSSGPTGEGDPLELMKGWRYPDAQKALVERLHPRGIALFHGALDPDKINFAEKLIIKGVKAPTGDFRDWEAVKEWAGGIAELLKQFDPAEI